MTIQTRIIDIINESGTIFKDKEVFTTEYLPEQYYFRDNQLRAMASHYVGITEGVRPSNLLLKGTYGTGKSSTVKTFFNTIKTISKDILTVHINCVYYNTEFKIIHKIFETVYDTRIGLGSSTHQLFDKIIKKLRKDDKLLIICLDDYNSFSNNKELNTTLYNLLRATESYPGVRISLIAVTNKSDDFVRLDQNVNTVFHPVVIDFPSYHCDEIFSILRQRCVLGFHKGVIGDDVIGLVADRSWDVGDLRFGIVKLRSMGERAEFLHSDCVLSSHF